MYHSFCGLSSFLLGCCGKLLGKIFTSDQEKLLFKVYTALLLLHMDVISKRRIANATFSFTGQVKLHSILLRSSPSDSAPRTLKVFINRSDMDFETASELDPTQEFELSQTSEIQELPVKRALFGKVQRVSLFLEDNFGDGDEDVTRLSYLGFKGEWMQLGRAPVNILYEAAPNPNDHAVKGTNVNAMGSGIGGRGSGV
jgi:hypothetical protein